RHRDRRVVPAISVRIGGAAPADGRCRGVDPDGDRVVDVGAILYVAGLVDAPEGDRVDALTAFRERARVDLGRVAVDLVVGGLGPGETVSRGQAHHRRGGVPAVVGRRVRTDQGRGDRPRKVDAQVADGCGCGVAGNVLDMGRRAEVVALAGHERVRRAGVDGEGGQSVAAR